MEPSTMSSGRTATLEPGRFEVAALIGSVAVTLLGAWWMLAPSAYPFGPGDRYHDMSLIVHLHADQAALAFLASGMVSGAVAAAVLLRALRPVWSRWGLVAVAGTMALMYGYVVPDIMLLIFVAYALTLALPALAVFLLVSRHAARRRPEADTRSVLRTAVTAALASLAVTLTLLTVLGRPWEWASGNEGHTSLYRPVVLLCSVFAGLAWAGVAVRAVRSLAGTCLRCGRPGPSWTSPESAARWGRVVTWAAALTPLPYVLARLTWLTPWPYGESPENLANNPALWVFGLGLAAAGELGTWLTLGLIRRRGEVFPRWLPVWGGQSVPPMMAVVPGFAIALLMCVGGHSVVQQAFGPGTTWEDHSLVILVPLPFWGPLLGLSTLAYWYRRRGSCHLRADRTGPHPPAQAATVAGT